MRNGLQVALLGAALVVSGCAEYPKRINAAYIPSIVYSGASCTEILRERGKMVKYVRSIAEQQKRAANADSAGMTVAFVTPLVIAWSGLLTLPFTKDQSAQLAVARGHYNALVQASQDQGCTTATGAQSSYSTNWKRYPGDFPPL
ncbi:MAG: hypothetical protein L3J30_15385 [Marinosulfonomonas sp.]|nr:hypothetical protein [Marinosulfonomonas sp.]